MKLIIQIPCFNEAATLPIALAELPRYLPGVDEVELLVIDDGSSDDTAAVARQNGVHHVVGFRRNLGLARAFMLGIHACLERGADVIVNTDADNQYNAADIPALIQPILERRADLVIGARPITEIAHFSPIKKLLQRFGSYVVRRVSGTDVLDAPSGFRAISRDAAFSLNVFNDYTYTLETLILAGQKGMRVISVPGRVNGDLRPSRLVRSISSYVKRSILTIFRIFIVYQPLKFFDTVGSIPFAAGLALGIRFLVRFLQGEGGGHIQSLILAAIAIVVGAQILTFGMLGSLVRANRLLLQDIRMRVRRLELRDRD
jgi:glycosyltransferase involved in cell wall biosynthesis